jgi:hypothetical protein
MLFSALVSVMMMPTASDDVKVFNIHRRASHEAGHAVVWHAVGGLVEEVSIASSRAGYKGYCRFGFLMPKGDEVLPPDEWLQRGRIDPRTVTAYYAGMLATAYYCASYGGEDDYLDGSEQNDLEKIQTLLLRLSSDEQQRSAIKDTCWMEAQHILSDSWPAVQALATKLLKRRTLDGKEVHRLIWQTIGYPETDWSPGHGESPLTLPLPATLL